MSGNQKQQAAVGPQQSQRFQGPYMPRPPTPQRTETFHVSTPPTYVPQQPQAQPGSQGPLRTIGPAGPPTQPTTPPNTEIKVQQMPQQTSMGITYVQQQTQVRGTQNFYRSQAPASQTQRMTNHRQGQQAQLYQTQPAPFVPLQTVQPMYLAPTNMSYYNGGARQPGYVQTPPYQVLPGQHIQYAPYQPSQGHQTQPSYFFQPAISMQRTGPTPPVPAGPQNPTQPPPPNIPMIPNTQQHPPQRQPKKRTHAIPIIDPVTGQDRLADIFDDSSHPPSGESSARQTPQPPPPNTSKEVQATFAKQVAQAIGNDESVNIEHHHPPVVDHIEHPVYQHNSPQAVNSSYDNIVQSSKLQAQTKEFIPANQNIDKETPVVSALTDAVEVTIANKQPKDRESPVKSRKQREQHSHKEQQPPPPPQQQHVYKELPKEPPVVEKQVVSKEEVKHKENVPGVPAPFLPGAGIKDKDVGNVGQKDEGRRNQRKEKSEPKAAPPSVAVTHEVPESSSPVSTPQSPALSQEGPSTGAGKSKQNASQRNKDGGKQQPPQPQHQQQPQPQVVAQKQAAVPVPQSQPAKPSSKTSKMKEINSKGANKEGTDMDAFNDNTTPTDVVNANVANVAATVPTNDNFNVSPVIVNANAAPPTPNAVANNKRTEANDVIAKPEAKPLPVAKARVDVTSIVRDSPKPAKTFVVPDAADETDHAIVVSTEKLVQAKNEVNAKASKENVDSSNIMKERTHLPYRKDQWSPMNPEGKKVYDVEFLLALRNDPKSNRKPDNIHSDVYRAISAKSSGGGRSDFAPQFGSAFMGKSSSAHQPPPKRNSQSKMGGGGNKGNKPNIRVSISVREDVKLHETENAWKPARFNAGQEMTEDEKKTEELYRKVRGVLNKLTPQKFDTLISQVRELTIDTKDRLQGVIDLVFEKAVDEPNFSNGYALMCKHLGQLQVPTSESKKKDNAEFVNFRKLLITRCQLEFEKNSADESTRNQMVKELEACTDAEKKKELQLNLEEYDRRIRMKSVGNIRFIGELYKQSMLTASIMMRCLHDLIEKKDEERLECLCKLLTTVGRELEHKKEDLNPIFNKMKEIVDKKHGKVSSRIRFMLQDVIDLRRNKWVPRRQDSNPKTIDQIQKEAETEQLNIQAMNAVPLRKDERGSSGPSSDRKNRRNVSNDDGWSTATSRNRTSFTIQSDKLKNRAPLIDEPLGSSGMHCVWSRGSGSTIKTPQTSVPTTTGNMYAALENISTEMDKRGAMGAGNRPGGKDPYSSKGPSMERTYKQYSEDGRGSRSGSQHRSNDGSLTGPPSMRSSPAPSAPAPAPAAVAKPPAQAPPVLDEEQLERRLRNILEEYLNECCTIEECDQDIKDSLPRSALPSLVSRGYIDILERSKTARLQTGLLFAKLIKLGTLSLEDYCSGLEEVLAQVDDLIIDIPKIWDYLGEILLHPVCTEALSVKTLHKCCDVLICQKHAGNLLKSLFGLVIEEKGPNFLQSVWQASGLTFDDFLPGQDASKFIKDNGFEFLLGGVGGGGTRQGQGELSYEQIHEKLLQLFESKASFDEIVNWINANVGERAKEKQFIRTLATAIFENSIVKNKLNPETLKGHYRLIHRFVDNKAEYELQCLFALQALINKLEHPQGILLVICSKLYEDGVLPQDCFILWEQCNDPAELEGKGVALKQLTSFFTQLKENDDEESASSASDDA